MIRILVLAGGLAGAATLSQYPEFSQQYLQRLGGEVDALTVVVRDFDDSALEAGLGREDALGQMVGTPFLTLRQADMRGTFARHAVLSENLAALQAAGPLARLAMPHRLADVETLRATLAVFQPALPLSVAGIAAGAVGFGGGALMMSMLLGVVLLPFRRRAALVLHGAGRGAALAMPRGRAFDTGPDPRHEPRQGPNAGHDHHHGQRAEPPVARPRPVLVPDAPKRPRLMGEKR